VPTCCKSWDYGCHALSPRSRADFKGIPWKKVNKANSDLAGMLRDGLRLLHEKVDTLEMVSHFPKKCARQAGPFLTLPVHFIEVDL
jgi:hypothetical protein